MKKVLIISIVILSIISCKEKKSFLDTVVIKNCVNSKLDEKIDAYEEFKKVEDLLIKNNLLNDISKESYINLFDILNTSNSKDIQIRINEFHLRVSAIIKSRNNLIFTPTVINIFNCNKAYINSLKINKNSKYLNYKTVLDELMKKGNFDDFTTIKKLINSIPKNDFLDINFRVPLISLYSLMSEHYFDNGR